MENERELLELAADAAGYEHVWNIDSLLVKGISKRWNPLKDDGDALRLAAALKLHILHNDPGESILWVSAVLNKTMLHGADEFQAEDGRTDATRRAIVRAAAEIGRAMQSDKR